MNLEQLIKLADLLDSRGEHDAASEIDKLIKAGGPFDEPTDPNIERPKWVGEEEPTAVTGPPTMMEDEPTEQDWPIDEEEQARWDEEETEKMMNEFDAAVNEAKNMLERGVGSHIQLHAGREVRDATEALKKMSAYIKDQLRMQREGDMADDTLPKTEPFDFPPAERVPEVKPDVFPMPKVPKTELAEFELPVVSSQDKCKIEKRALNLSTMIRQLWKRTPIENRYAVWEQLRTMVDQLKPEVQKYAPRAQQQPSYPRAPLYPTEQPGDLSGELPLEPIPRGAALSGVFEKLAKVADDLDEAGARKEADMIDSFLQKYSIEEKEEAEEIIKELEKLESRREVLISKLSNEPVKHKLSKRADDYDEDRKDEADTEQSKRYDEKHHHKLQIREPKTDKERVDREGRKEHHVETYKQVEAHHLSTRYCPEHIGTQMGRVGQGVFQCPLDGQVYNWEAGWT
jgi:hypothetical protein